MTGPVIIYTAGVWDLLHRGHFNVLWESKRLGDALIVGVVSDAGCHAYKGFFPQENVQLRVRALEALGFIDHVVIQPTTDPTSNLERFKPDVFTHADGDGDWSILRERVEKLGIEYIDLPYTDGISSTLLRGKRREDPEARFWDMGASEVQT